MIGMCKFVSMGFVLLQDLKESQICEGGNGQKDFERRLSFKLDFVRFIKLRNGGGRYFKREVVCEDRGSDFMNKRLVRGRMKSVSWEIEVYTMGEMGMK